MSNNLLSIKLNKLIETIVAILLNKFDCFVVIEGTTGSGKSTLAYHLARGVRKEFKRLKKLDSDIIEKYYEKVKFGRGETIEQFIEYLNSLNDNDAYHFNPRKDLIYSQKEMIRRLSLWNKILIPDEMINITFNRDFYSTDQKNIVKIFNMYRDHNNLVLACVPRFQTLDNQIQNLCKIRLTVVRRGIALLQTPNKTIYGKDRWDTANNEKIEREWLIKNKSGKNPRYMRLTTARGIVTFKRLKPNIEAKYQIIKNEKRSVILHSEMDVKEEKGDKIDIITERLIKGGVRDSSILEGYAIAENMSSDNLKNKIRRKLEKLGLNPLITEYYYKKIGKNPPKETKDEIKNEVFRENMAKFGQRFK